MPPLMLACVVGLFASNETTDAVSIQTLVPAARDTTAVAERSGDTYSLFATGNWRFAPDWEFTAGVRFDEEKRHQDSSTEVSTAPGVIVVDPRREIEASEVEPRFTLSRFFGSDGMVYASAAKGYRGGGFNSPRLHSTRPEYRPRSWQAIRRGRTTAHRERAVDPGRVECPE